jgi:hypothetical protein
MPFMSKYSASNSSPFGFGPDMSVGTGTEPSPPSAPGAYLGCSSLTSETIFGYFFESQRKRAGTPMAQGVDGADGKRRASRSALWRGELGM